MKPTNKIYQFDIVRQEIDKSSITYKMFKEFIVCQQSGVFNMMDLRVRKHLKITKEQHKFMLFHLEDLKKFFNTNI